MLQPHFEGVVRSQLTLPKMELGNPPGLPKTQSVIARVKTPRIRAFLLPFGKFLKCRCPKWPHMSHLDICSTSYGRKKGRESNWQFDSRPLKVGNRPNSGAWRWSATHRWKALEESYNFGSYLISIRVWGKELWASKVPGVHTGIFSGLHFASPRKKSHLDASPMENCR